MRFTAQPIGSYRFALCAAVAFMLMLPLPAVGQSLSASASPERTVPSRADVQRAHLMLYQHPTHPIPVEAHPVSTERYFVRLSSLGGVTRAAHTHQDRPDSDLPAAMRYALGSTLAVVSVSSLVGGVWLGRASVQTLRGNTELSTPLGLVVGIASAGALGLSVTSGVWSVRLFRGKAVLTAPEAR